MKQKPQQSPSSPIQLNHTEADLWAQVKEVRVDGSLGSEELRFFIFHSGALCRTRLILQC